MMPIITISRGSYSKGKEVAEKVAQKLGFKCISREIILEASEEFHVPEIRLIRAIHDAPGILDRLSHKKDKYIACIQTELLKHFCKDNVVYHGLAGQHFVKGISHVLKVRIIADMEDRVRLEMEREGISRKEAMHTLQKDDKERAKWSQHLYGIDSLDSSLYDMVLHIHKISVDAAVDIICYTSGLKDFQSTPQSQKAIDDLFLTAQVTSAVIDLNHDITISVKDGIVFVKCEAAPLQQSQLSRDIKKIVEEIPGAKEVRIDVEPIFPLSE
jgi:cytidylate kinase